MKFGTYRQYDSRWGKKNYNGSSTYASAACGPTSCANILYAVDPSITPVTTGKYMQSHGYAIRNQGTAWDGIPACLKAFGATDVRQVVKMADVFDLMSKGYVGIFLFRKGTKGGVTWTTSGHYIAVTGYKHKNGKHYIRTFDSGGRKHDGWYCYETQMKGLLPKIWLCKVVEKVAKPKGKYKGAIPKPTLKRGSKGDSVKSLQKFLNWYHPEWKLTVDGKLGAKTAYALRCFQYTEGIGVDAVYGKNSYKHALAYEYVETDPPEEKPPEEPKEPTPQEKAIAWARAIAKNGTYKYVLWTKDKKTHLCPVCHPELKGKYHGWQCIGFVGAAYYHGAGLRCIKCECNGLGTNSFFTKVTEESWRKRNGKDWKMITNGGKKGGKSIPLDKLKAGDILICYDAKGVFHHVVMYTGNGMYIECTRGRKPQIGERPMSKLSKKHITRAFRYTGK